MSRVLLPARPKPTLKPKQPNEVFTLPPAASIRIMSPEEAQNWMTQTVCASRGCYNKAARSREIRLHHRLACIGKKPHLFIVTKESGIAAAAVGPLSAVLSIVFGFPQDQLLLIGLLVATSTMGLTVPLLRILFCPIVLGWWGRSIDYRYPHRSLLEYERVAIDPSVVMPAGLSEEWKECCIRGAVMLYLCRTALQVQIPSTHMNGGCEYIIVLTERKKDEKADKP